MATIISFRTAGGAKSETNPKTDDALGAASQDGLQQLRDQMVDISAQLELIHYYLTRRLQATQARK